MGYYKSYIIFLCSIYFLLASCVTPTFLKSKKTSTSFQYQLNELWFTPFINNNTCFNSILTDPKQDNDCLTWTRLENAGPLYDEKRKQIYVGGSDSLLHVLNTKGQLQKTIKLPGNLQAQPTLVDDHLYFGTENGNLLKLNVNNYNLIWELKVDSEINTRLVHRDNLLFFSTGLSTLYAVETNLGKVVWSQKRVLPSKIFIKSQAEPLVTYFEGDKSKLILVSGHPSGRVDYYEAKTGKLIFNLMVGNPQKDFPDIVADPIFYKDSIFVASYNSGVVSLEPTTGEVRWRVPLKGKSRLAAGYDMIFAAGDEFITGIDAQSGTRKWRFNFGKGSPTNMVIKDGFLYFASDKGQLYVLEVYTGEPVRYFGSGLGFAGQFDFSSNVLFLVSTAGYLYAMSPDFKGFVQRSE